MRNQLIKKKNAIIKGRPSANLIQQTNQNGRQSRGVNGGTLICNANLMKNNILHAESGTG